jgi:hypothetical protein
MAMPALGFEQQPGFGGGATDPYIMMLMRRRALAEALQKQQGQQPMTHPLQVLGSIAQQGVGAWQQDKAEKEYLTYAQQQQAAQAKIMQDALRDFDAKPQATPMPAAPGPMNAPAQSGGGGFYSTLRGAESGGRVDAANPRSSARGPDQFIDGTWLEFAKANPQHFQGMDQAQILAARTDPKLAPTLSGEATRWYAGQNANALKAAGLPANDFTVALGHRFGPGDAVKLLQADPNAPAASVLSKAVLDANPNLGPATVGAILRPLQGQFGTGQTFAEPPTQSAQAAPQSPQMPPQSVDQRQAMVDRARRLMATGSPQAQRAAMQILALAKATPEPPNWTTTNVGGQVMAINPRNPSQMMPLGPSNDFTPIPEARIASQRAVNAPAPAVAATPERHQQDIERARTGAQNVSVNTDRTYSGEVAKSLSEIDTKRYEAAESAGERIAASRRIRQLLNENPIVGPGQPVFMALAKGLNIVGLSDGERVTATQNLMTEMANVTLSSIKSSGLGAGNGFTNTDREFLEKAKAGLIEFTPTAIRRISELNERVAMIDMKRGNDVLKRWRNHPVLRDHVADRADFSEPAEEMIAKWSPQISGGAAPAASAGSSAATGQRQIPPEAVQMLRSGRGTPEQFDAQFGPGSAARVMGQQ